MLLRAEPGKQRPRSCRTQELARSSGPRKGVAEKGWLTQLDESWYDRRTTSTYETKKRSRMYVRGFARWKNSKEASEGQYRIVGTGQSAARGGGHSTVGVARRKSQRQQTHYLAYRGFTGVAVLREPRNLRKLSFVMTHRPKSVATAKNAPPVKAAMT